MLGTGIFALLICTAFCGIPTYENNAKLTKYDYIIVGAGSAGCALANRLSEDGNNTVLVLEAGGPPPEMSEIPLFTNGLKRTEAEWDNTTEPQKNACQSFPGQRCPTVRFKALGGGSGHNHMLYIRGNKEDYDNWERIGAEGWNYDSVLKIFKKMEDFTIQEYKDNDFHGQGGYQTVSPLLYKTKLGDAFLDAGSTLEYDIVDYNGPTQKGFSRVQLSQRDGFRCSAEKSFLRPAMQRKNLDILIHAYVLKVKFDNDKKVKSVVFDHQSKTKEIEVGKEVILSAGTMSSAKILLLSGIGPKNHLDEMEIPVVADVPGVGQNLQDHMGLPFMNFMINDSVGIVYKDTLNEKAFSSLVNGSGPLTSPGFFEVLGFVNTQYQIKENENWPDAIVMGLASSMFTDGKSTAEYNGTSMTSFLLRPKSRGVLKLRSTNPYDDPSIDPNYFSVEDDFDRSIDVMRKQMEIMHTPALQRYSPQPMLKNLVGCEMFDHSSDDHIKCAIQRFATGGAQFAGTCKMGDPNDNSTVVDPKLRVKGVTGLRVADASIMPTLVSATLNAPCMMIGYKAGEMILSNE